MKKRTGKSIKQLIWVGVICLAWETFGCSDGERYPLDLGNGWFVYEIPAELSGNDKQNSWYSVEVIGRDDIWFAGEHIEFEDEAFYPYGALIHWNGSGWNYVELFGVNDSITSITSLSFISSNEGWGLAIAGVFIDGVWVLKWNGSTWDKDTLLVFHEWTPNSGKICFSATDEGWMVLDTCIFHYNGLSWTHYAVPYDITPYFDIDFSSPENIWIAGDGGLLHWNGSVWTLEEAGQRFTAVDAVDSNCVWAGGESFVAHWDGSSWSYENLGVNISDLCFPSRIRGWASSDWGDREGIYGYSGTLWSQEVDYSGAALSLDFLDDSYGWAGGHKYVFEYEEGR